MKLSCKIIEDLLPLYADNVCSEQSKAAVEEHLKECEVCKNLIESACNVTVPDIIPEKSAADKAAKRSFKKIRLRYFVTILSVILLIPSVILGWNQYHGYGIHFTNLNELRTGSAFMRQLASGNYDNAYKYVNIEHKKEEWLAEWFDEDKLVDIEEKGLEKFCESAAALDEVGGITDYQYLGILKEPFGYQLIYTLTLDGEKRDLKLDVNDNGILSFQCDGSFLDDPLAYFSIWSEWLWEDYAGCYFDFESKQYVYYDARQILS